MALLLLVMVRVRFRVTPTLTLTLTMTLNLTLTLCNPGNIGPGEHRDDPATTHAPVRKSIALDAR